MQTEQLLCWSGMTDTEHSTTSTSNEEEKNFNLQNNFTYQVQKQLQRLAIAKKIS